jgi:hypothetical protein
MSAALAAEEAKLAASTNDKTTRFITRPPYACCPYASASSKFRDNPMCELKEKLL